MSDARLHPGSRGAARIRRAAWGVVLPAFALLWHGCAIPIPTQAVLEQGSHRPGAEAATPEMELTVDRLAQLEDRNRAFADNYFTLMSGGCDAIEAAYQSASPEDLRRRRAAQLLRLSSLSAAYDVVTNPNPWAQSLDLYLLAALQSRILGDDGRAAALFGDAPSRELVDNLARLRQQAEEILLTVLNRPKLAQFDLIIDNWAAENPGVDFVAFVRFGDLKDTRAKSLIADAPRAQGILAPVDEARLFGERVFFVAKRAPMIAASMAQATVNDLLSTPEVQSSMDAIRQVSESSERLAKAAEALPAQVEAMGPEARATLVEYRSAVQESRDLVTAMRELVTELRGLAGAADSLVSRVAPAGPAEAPAAPASAGALSPDPAQQVRDAASQISQAARDLTALVNATQGALDRRTWEQPLGQAQAAADGRIDRAAQRLEELIQSATWKLGGLIVVFFVLLVAARLITGRAARAA